MSLTPLLIVQLAAIAAFAGFAAWPVYVIPLFGAFWVGWDFVYFGTKALNTAAGGTQAYLLRKWALCSVLSAVFYAAGFAIKLLLG